MWMGLERFGAAYESKTSLSVYDIICRIIVLYGLAHGIG
jgi:hypothetical protein